MRIKSLRLAGWRSFAGSQPLEIGELSSVNIIVGANNTGKSNLGRFLSWLASINTTTLPSGGAPPMLQHAVQNSSPTWPYGLAVELADKNRWLEESAPVTALLVLDAEGIPCRGDLGTAISGDPGAQEITIDYRWADEGPSKGAHSYLVPRSRTGEPYFRGPYGSGTEIWREPTTYTTGNTPDQTSYIPLLLCQIIADGIVRIPAVRHELVRPLDSNATRTPTGAFSIGARVVQSLALLNANTDSGRQYAVIRRNLERWMRLLLARPDLRIDFVNAANETVKGRVKFSFESPAPHAINLEAMGDGVAQMFYVLAYLALQPDRPKVICLDDPENSLHPAAVVELIRIIRLNFPQTQLIITTHSTTMLDAVEPDWTLFRMEQDEQARSYVTLLDNHPSRLALLERLGIRPSQLFLANALIWVEGPSDLVYLRALLRHKKVAADLVAGRDYTFIIFGGASGKALVFDSGENINNEAGVTPLEIAVNNIIVHDADGDPAKGDTHARVARLRSELGAMKVEQAIFQTPGREIENLVRCDLLIAEAKKVAPAYLRDDGHNIRLTYGAALVGPGDSFDKSIAEAATTTDGTELTPEQRRRIQRQLSRKKSEIARAVTRHENVFNEEAIDFGRAIAAKLSRR